MVSVSKLIEVLNKPALLHWSNKIGLQGISLKDYRKKSTSKGTSKHNQIENYLLNGVIFEESYKLDNLLKDYNILGVEKSIDNGHINGRYDLLLEKDGKKIVVDFKSNGKIYLNHKLQLSTYKEILEADKIGIINFNDWRLDILEIDTYSYYEIMFNLYEIYNKIENLNEKL
jgi:hypothetical protein